MAYGVVHHFAGGTKDQYEASLRAVHPGAGLPEGQIFHAAGPSEGGWTVLAVHDSQESGSGSATRSSCPACKRASKVASPARPRRP